MSLFRTYLMGIVSAAMVVALAQALTPEGTVKRSGGWWEGSCFCWRW